MTDGAHNGELDEKVDTAKLLLFRDGIPGFPECQHFMLVELDEDSPFQLLQCVEDEQVAMVVTVPWLFFSDYAPELPLDDQRDLAIEQPEDAVVFCPVTMDPENESVYLNLLGPFIVNVHTREGRQVVLQEGAHPVRAAIPLGT